MTPYRVIGWGIAATIVAFATIALSTAFIFVYAFIRATFHGV